MSKILEKLAELEELESEYVAAEAAVRSARIEETQALNRLNTLQKEIDSEMDSIRNASPAGDWVRRERG